MLTCISSTASDADVLLEHFSHLLIFFGEISTMYLLPLFKLNYLFIVDFKSILHFYEARPLSDIWIEIFVLVLWVVFSFSR